MTPTQENNALTANYIKLWKKKYPQAGSPNFNANKATFGWKAMRMTMTLKEIKALVDFHFSLDDPVHQHDLTNFLWDYDRIADKMEVSINERARKKRLMSESEKRVAEFKERVARIKND